jgi:hypothetical protein
MAPDLPLPFRPAMPLESNCRQAGDLLPPGPGPQAAIAPPAQQKWTEC